jgi:hypothetical protein
MKFPLIVVVSIVRKVANIEYKIFGLFCKYEHVIEKIFRQKKCKLNETYAEKKKDYFEDPKNKISDGELVFDYVPLPTADMIETHKKNEMNLRGVFFFFLLIFFLEKEKLFQFAIGRN